MSFLEGIGKKEGTAVSPIQQHNIQIATDTFWAVGQLESLGDPHLHINKDDLSFLKVLQARLEAWDFTGLPTTHAPQALVNRDKIQLLIFTQPETLALRRQPPRTVKVMLYLSLFVVRGEVPLFSEANIGNFSDFWKGTFIPVSNAALHFLAGGPSHLPGQAPLVYVNRLQLQGYTPA